MNDDDLTIKPDQLQQIGHDIKTHVLVLTMGLELLKDARTDEARFNEVVETLRQDGLNPLKVEINTLLQLAREGQSRGVRGEG